MSRPSIRRRLLGGIALVQMVATVLATVLVVRHERARSYAVLEAELVEHATMVTSVLEAPDSPTDHTVLHRELLTLPKDDVYVLNDSEGRVIASSGRLHLTAVVGSAQQTFVDTVVGGVRYRVLIERGISMFEDDPVQRARLPKLTLVYGAPAAAVEEHIRRVAWIAGGLGLAILTLSLLAAGWVVRAGLRPVVHLAGSAGKIDATHWDWQGAHAEGDTEELAPLSLALTRLVERLRDAFLRERQFSADAAHEMKTAVAIVKSTLELALERDGSAAEYRAQIELALEDTERMQGLVSGMLQLAKIEGLGSGEAEAAASVDAVEQVRTTARRLGPTLETRGMRIAFDPPRAPACVRISADALDLVLMNLLENAIHYSPEGSAISLRVEQSAQTCTITIADEGSGIDAKALPHIFERFYRGDASRSRDSGGAGLGLAIVQAIVHRNGGTVTAASTPDAGSVFRVTLPRAQDA